MNLILSPQSITAPNIHSSVIDQVLIAITGIHTILNESQINELSEDTHENRILAMRELKRIKEDVSETRIDAFRDIGRIQTELKASIDAAIIAPIDAKLKEIKKAVEEYEREQDRVRIAELAKNRQTQEVKPAPSVTAKKQMRWTCEVIEDKDVPREYCIPDMAKLNGAVRSGIRSIPGCKIYQKEYLS